MKKIMIIVIAIAGTCSSLNAQSNLFWGQTEMHIFEDSRSMYGVASYEHYFENGAGVWSQTVFNTQWGKVLGGISYSKFWEDKAFIEGAVGLGYETNLSRPRFGGMLFGTIHTDGDGDNRKGTLTVLYNPEYGHSFYHFGFILYNVSDWLQVGMMLQPDGSTGPRIQGNFGHAGSVRPWVSAGYSTDLNAWGVSAGMRYKIPW